MRRGLIRAALATALPLAGLGLWRGTYSVEQQAPTLDSPHPHREGEDRYPIERTVRYRTTVRNRTSSPIRGSELLIYAPVPQTATQQVRELTASHPFETVTDGHGNQSLRFRIDLPPYGTLLIAVEAAVGFADRPRPTTLSHATELTRAEPYVEVDDPAIQAVAATLAGSTPEGISRRAFEYAADHVVESGYVAEDRGALNALRSGQGDCTESMYLFIALARARQLPARGMEGFVIESNAVLRSDRYHNWAEYYADGTWHLVDPQRRVFGAGEKEHYLAMRVMAAGGSALVTRTRRFESKNAGVEARLE